MSNNAILERPASATASPSPQVTEGEVHHEPDAPELPTRPDILTRQSSEGDGSLSSEPPAGDDPAESAVPNFDPLIAEAKAGWLRWRDARLYALFGAVPAYLEALRFTDAFAVYCKDRGTTSRFPETAIFELMIAADEERGDIGGDTRGRCGAIIAWFANECRGMTADDAVAKCNADGGFVKVAADFRKANPHVALKGDGTARKRPGRKPAPNGERKPVAYMFGYTDIRNGFEGHGYAREIGPAYDEIARAGGVGSGLKMSAATDRKAAAGLFHTRFHRWYCEPVWKSNVVLTETANQCLGGEPLAMVNLQEIPAWRLAEIQGETGEAEPEPNSDTEVQPEGSVPEETEEPAQPEQPKASRVSPAALLVRSDGDTVFGQVHPPSASDDYNSADYRADLPTLRRQCREAFEAFMASEPDEADCMLARDYLRTLNHPPGVLA